MRDFLVAFGKARARFGKMAEARLIGRFARARVEPLHADADAEKRNAARDGCANGRREAGRVEPLSGREVANAGQHDALCGFNQSKVAIGDDRLRAEMAQGLEHRGQIARFVVDDGYAHHKQSFGRGQHFAELFVARAGYAQGARKGLEDGLDLVMVRAAVHGLDVNVGAGAAGEAFEEVGDQFGLQVADQARANLGVNGEGGAAAQVDGGDGEGFVHRHEEVSGAQNAALVAECAVECLAERDADVFDGVMLIDIEIAVALEFEIECAVAREQLQHVIEEANAGGDFVLAAAFDGEPDGDARFCGVALDDAQRALSI